MAKKLRMELMQHNTLEPILERLLNYTEEEHFFVSCLIFGALGLNCYVSSTGLE